MNIKRLTYLLLTGAMIAGTSCERLPLYDEEKNIELQLVLQLEEEIEGTLQEPEVMRSLFYHPEEKHILAEEFTGPTGGRIYVEPGDYHLLSYNFDTESTHVRDDHHHNTIEAYTNNVQAEERAAFEIIKKVIEQKHLANSRGYLDEPVIYEPDHLFVANVEGVNVPRQVQGETTVVIHADAQSIVEVYSIHIGPITGEEYIAKATVYLTGQIQSRKLASGDATGVPSTIYFPISVDGTTKEFVGTFRTFGKYPGVESRTYLVVDIVDTGGGHSMWEWDVTDQFRDGNRDIVIKDEVDIDQPKEGGGGFDPVVNLWDEYNIDIDL